MITEVLLEELHHLACRILWVKFTRCMQEKAHFSKCVLFFFNDSHLASVILLATDVHSTLYKWHIKMQRSATCCLDFCSFWIICSEVTDASDRRCGSSSVYDCGVQSWAGSEGNMQLPSNTETYSLKHSNMLCLEA